MRLIRLPAVVLLVVLGCGACGQSGVRLTADASGPHVSPALQHSLQRQLGRVLHSRPRAGLSLSRTPPRVDPIHRGGAVTRQDRHFERAIERGVMIPKDPALLPPKVTLRAASRVISTHIRGQRVVILVPRHPNHRAILFAHGADETANLDVDVRPSSPTIAALLAAGYTWAESDAGFNNWGNAKSLVDQVGVADWLRRHGDRVIDVGGDSMGGLDATQLIPLVHPQAVFELFPVCNLRSVLDRFGTDVALAHTDVARLSPVSFHDARGLPMLITASPRDTVVPKVTNADVCYSEARADGADVTEVTTRGQHDNPSNWRPARLIHFLNRAAHLQL